MSFPDWENKFLVLRKQTLIWRHTTVMSQLSGKKVDSIGFQKGGGGSRIGIF